MKTLVNSETRAKISNRILEENKSKIIALKQIEQIYLDNGFTIAINSDIAELIESFKELSEFQLEYDKSPIHKHDCNQCTYLCHVNGSDLYFCGEGYRLKSTVISRDGIDGDYASSLSFAHPDMHNKLYIARVIAEEVGLLKTSR